jgi:hypothetical protein
MTCSTDPTMTTDRTRCAVRRHDLLDGPDDDDRHVALRDGNPLSGAMTVIDLR